MALHSMSIDGRTGLPYGEAPPASTASVVALVAGFLLCLGPITGMVAVIAGFVGLRAAARDPAAVGGRGLATAGIVLGLVNLVVSAAAVALLLVRALAG